MALGVPLDWSFVAGDTNSALVVTCKDKDGVAIDITSATVTLKWSVDGATAVSKTMTVTDGPNGVASYTFATGELVAGIMKAEVRVTAAGKTVTSVEPFTFTVRPAL
jgi:hypothetical protein